MAKHSKARLSKRAKQSVCGFFCIVFISATSFVLSSENQKKKLPEPAKTKIDFVKQIQPIFQKKCITCHGAEESESDLRLDIKKRAFVGGENGKVIIPGNSAKSTLIHAVAGLDEDLLMPPEDEGTPLTKEQVALLRAWIDQGANWPDGVDSDSKVKGADHWAFQPIKNPKPPVIKSPWIHNEIDAFILSKLNQEKIKPSSVAKREVQIRRLYLDLIGIPPTPKQWEQWMKDKRTNWYECFVDELLKSPHYGERWGRLWLDQARYADSDGYEKDNARVHAWRWRDWVINALNEDQPFDQFTIDQLAGDLLPNATLKQKIATGFQRNTLVNREGGTDQEEDRVKRTVDRTNTLGKVWLGMTVECTQCHTHKYDPLTQREFYQLYAFFNNLSEPDVPAASKQQMDQYQLALQQYNEQNKLLTAAVNKYRMEKFPFTQAKWEKEALQQQTIWQETRPDSVSATSGAKLSVLPDASILVQGTEADKDVYTWTAKTKMKGLTAVKIEVLPDATLKNRGPGRSGHGNFVLSEISITVQPITVKPNNGPQNPKTIKMQNAQANFSQDRWDVSAAIDGKPETGWGIAPNVGKLHTAVFETTKKIQLDGPSLVTIKLSQQHGSKHTIGKFRISLSSSPTPVAMIGLPKSIVSILKKPLEKRSKKQKQAIAKYYEPLDKALVKLQKSTKQHLKKKPEHPGKKNKAQTVVEKPKARTTKIHIRGNFLRKGGVVKRMTPAILPPLKIRGKQADRLDLASWLMNEKNPLTARVTVNRIWQQYFGRGIVATSHDFGTQGEKPSHPELLDYLATSFRKSGWRLKSLHRLIVTSATYRQSSRNRKELKQRDPYNSWLAHQNRIRVEAETVRDLSLAASGLLSHKIGGPSVYPPQPKGMADLGYASSVRWITSKGEDRYRRGLYTFFKRTVPYPMFMTFDAPDSNLSCTQRGRSNTPLQALTLWNDPVFLECAQHLGVHIVREGPKKETTEKTNQERLKVAFIRCFSRLPEKEEQRDILAFYQLQYQSYKVDPKQAVKLIGKTAQPKNADPAAIAAWIVVSRAMMNFDEFITKE